MAGVVLIRLAGLSPDEKALIVPSAIEAHLEELRFICSDIQTHNSDKASQRIVIRMRFLPYLSTCHFSRLSEDRFRSGARNDT